MFLLQQGWGMLQQIKELIINGSATGAIMSPRICDRNQMEKHLPIIGRLARGHVFFDPHFYEPRTDLEKVLTYPYFEELDFTTGRFDHREFCTRVVKYQREVLSLDNIIIPGRYTNSLNEAWLRMHYECAEHGTQISEGSMAYSTIAIGPDVVLNRDSMNSLVDEIVNYATQGVYLVYEHPRNSYFMNEEFLYILLGAFLSIALAGKSIIVGYGNQQSLAFLAAGVDAIGSGNYRNVRAFDHLNCATRDTDKWRKAIWYFDGQTFGEYRIPALSLAFRRGLKTLFGPSTTHAASLLNSDQPTSVRWSETDAFAHYLTLMHQYTNEICQQPKSLRLNTLIDFFRLRLEASRPLTEAGFSLGDRAFNESANTTLTALEAFRSDRSRDLQLLR
jgi:hypothetical protein